jgi:CDGSH-type Zn-finger protein
MMQGGYYEMNDVTIKVLDNGPFLVNGNAKIVDAEGNKFDSKAQTALCRCGLSANMPYCSGAHDGKFESQVHAK